MHVAFAGGGIVGICAAIAVRERGIDATVFEPEEPATRTVGGSACYLSPSEIVPLANPATLADMPKLLLNPLGPLVLRPAHLPFMIRWGLHFLAAARPANVERGIAALISLNQRANDATFALARRAGAETSLERNGALHVARTPEIVHKLRKEAEIIARAGMPVEVIDAARLHELEPEIAPNLAGGLFVPDDARVRDPVRFGERLVAYFKEIGGTIVREKVQAIVPEDGKWRVSPVHEPFTHAIVTAGAWSHELLSPLGYYVPLDTERGYNLTVPEPGITVNHAMVTIDPRMAITPLDYGLRLTGTVEFAGLKAAPNWRRSEILAKIARIYFPKLQVENATRWMGFRPALPDALPAIGKAARHNGLLYAFGHEHLGFTQAAITAPCVASLITGEASPIDLRPFDLERFRR